MQLESEDEEEAFDAERKLEALARKTDTWLAILQVRVRQSAREREREREDAGKARAENQNLARHPAGRLIEYFESSPGFGFSA